MRWNGSVAILNFPRKNQLIFCVKIKKWDGLAATPFFYLGNTKQ